MWVVITYYNTRIWPDGSDITSDRLFGPGSGGARRRHRSRAKSHVYTSRLARGIAAPAIAAKAYTAKTPNPTHADSSCAGGAMIMLACPALPARHRLMLLERPAGRMVISNARTKRMPVSLVTAAAVL